MDTSEQYIKMCEKAEEIQELRCEERHHNTGKWLNGDFYGSTLDNLVFVAQRLNDAWADEPYYIHHPSEAIWLPRQDQLQEMVSKYPGILIERFGTWYKDTLSSLPLAARDEMFFRASMEQLWLAFVMKKKYNKVWNGEEWK